MARTIADTHHFYCLFEVQVFARKNLNLEIRIERHLRIFRIIIIIMSAGYYSVNSKILFSRLNFFAHKKL